MSSFTKATGFRPSGNPQKPWEVTEDFKWYFEHPEGDSVIVPEGFVFNGADIPIPISFVWPRVDPDYMQSAALHDYMLDDLRKYLSRDFIDRQFYQSLLALGNHPWKAWLMYQAVKYYGILTEGKSQYYRPLT